MNSLIALYVTASAMLARTRGRFAAEDGQTAVEWLGIAAVIVAIVVFMASSLSDGIAREIGTLFEGLLGRAAGADGG